MQPTGASISLIHISCGGLAVHDKIWMSCWPTHLQLTVLPSIVGRLYTVSFNPSVMNTCCKGTAISPMSVLCRMYMFGTDAKGLPNDTAAVLTMLMYGRELNLLGQEPSQGFDNKMGYV